MTNQDFKLTDFDPPIANRKTIELIAIANGTTEFWQEEAIRQAQEELKKRNVSREYQDQVLQRWENKEEEREAAIRDELARNATESYPLWKLPLIMFGTPFLIIFCRFLPIKSLLDLHNEGYKKMFLQRLIMLVCGMVLWYIIIRSIDIM